MEKVKLVFISIVLLLLQSNLFSQVEDSVKNYWMSPVEVTAKRSIMAGANLDPSKDRLSEILGSHGFSLIRKGVFFAQDIYSDGLKKGDINVVVDNERYHTACPNRMDSPLIRVNPLEIESVELNKTNGDLLSGLGGVVNFKRLDPTDEFHIKTGISGTMGASENIDAALKVDGISHSATLRYATGSPYEDASGDTFSDLYGYNENYNYSLFETSFLGKLAKVKYGASYIDTKDVSFPYLMMDERMNTVFSSFFSYDNNKIYLNYTDHLMDNGLRVNPMGMTMSTTAKNLTIGVVGNYYEVYYRNWDSDNKFSNNSGMSINNHLMPNTKTISATVHHEINILNIGVSGKLGIVNQSMNDSKQESFFNTYYKVDGFSNWYPLFGISANYSGIIKNKVGYTIMLEAAGETPSTEELFISVVKPATNPNWVGNPNLSQPIRNAIRGMLAYNSFNLEVYFSQIWNYVNLTKIIKNKPIQTYKNVNAQIMGVNLNYTSSFFDLGMSYTYAENLTHNTPLSEIRPFQFNIALRSPKLWNTNLFLNAFYEAEQNRVDELLKEDSTPSWYRLDIGTKYELNNLSIRFEVENLTNELYFRHLSYSRNPFSTGTKVYEPGRKIYLSLNYSI
jgi:iron complex outermembrane recepter protein